MGRGPGHLLGLVVGNAFQILNVGCGAAPASGTPGGLVLEDAESNPKPVKRGEFVFRELRDCGNWETTRQRDALAAAGEVPSRRREANRNIGWDGDGTVDRTMRNKPVRRFLCSAARMCWASFRWFKGRTVRGGEPASVRASRAVPIAPIATSVPAGRP